MEILTGTHCDPTLPGNPSSHSLARDPSSPTLARRWFRLQPLLAVVQSNLSRTHGGHNWFISLPISEINNLCFIFSLIVVSILILLIYILFSISLICFSLIDFLVGVDLDEFGVELGGGHRVFVNLHERESEK